MIIARNLGFILFSLLLTSSSIAQHIVPKDPPRRLVLNVTLDPATSIAVTWRNAKDYADCKIQIAKATEWTSFTKVARTIIAGKEEFKVGDNAPGFHYSAVIDSLEPDVLYAYRVGHDSVWSGWMQFRTAKAKAEPFSFIYLGDPQNDILSHCTRVFHHAFKTLPDASFWLIAGDLISDPSHDTYWSELFTSLGFIPTTTPFVMVPGNHEYPTAPEGKQRTLIPYWGAHYTLPENGVKGLEETSFSFDYQGVRFIMINGNEKLSEQAVWVESLLAKNPCAWTIISMHQTLYSMARTRDDRRTRDAFLPLFDKYGVDLVLTGHDHVYSRSHKLRNNTVVPEGEKGTVYVVSVSGPKAYDLNLKYKDLMAKYAEKVQLFQTISIDGRKLTYKSYTATGESFDAFELTK